MADFEFKNFKINQSMCGMKVSTDGVLLGAWASGGRRVLDVGTGTGLIAMMIAQRFVDAQIVAIDIDNDACTQARQNIVSSIFADRVKVVECALQNFISDEQFDCVVSNPPFFIDSLKNPDDKRAKARHADSLPFKELFASVNRILTYDGVFSVIVPSECFEVFASEGYLLGYFVIKKYAVKTVLRKPAKRYLVSFSKVRTSDVDTREVCLLNPDGSRSEWYDCLTKDFYIK